MGVGRKNREAGAGALLHSHRSDQEIDAAMSKFDDFAKLHVAGDPLAFAWLGGVLTALPPRYSVSLALKRWLSCFKGERWQKIPAS